MAYFTDYEIHPCKSYSENGGEWVEQCEEHENPDFWTVYGRLNRGGLEAISDQASKEAAEELVAKIDHKLKTLQAHFLNLYQQNDHV